MTYYLKYRPQSFQDLDQVGVKNTLIKIFKSDKYPHAFLFSGPRGTGKTSAARIVAKVINCEHLSKDGVPCNKCDQCRSISRGDSLDVIELDAASHRGIDDVRQIREAVKLAPVGASKKVYIVDEAHMLTTEASNALLKTLEEPPSHVVFILATTNPEKLIETIRSRVTDIKFKKAGNDEIVSSLKRIAKGENIKIDDKSLELIAEKSDGSFRDAAKTFEQIVSELEAINPEIIGEFLSHSKSFVVEDFIKSLAEKNTKAALQLVSKASREGVSAKEILKSSVQLLRKLLLDSVDAKNHESFTTSELVDLLELFIEATSNLTNSYIEEVPIEIAVIKWCEGKNTKTLLQNSEHNQSTDNSKGSSSKLETVNMSKTTLTKKYSEVESGNKNKVDLSDEPIIENKTENVEVVMGNLKKVDSDFWAKVLSAVRPTSASTEALLRAAKPIGFDGNKLKLGVFYKFHKEHLESNQHRLVLEKTISSITGGELVRVVCELTEPEAIQKSEIVQNSDYNPSELILTEPEKQTRNSVLTNSNTEDIINLAEKIFSN